MIKNRRFIIIVVVLMIFIIAVLMSACCSSYSLVTPKIDKNTIIKKFNNNIKTFQIIEKDISSNSNDFCIDLNTKQDTYEISFNDDNSVSNGKRIEDKQLNKSLNDFVSNTNGFYIDKDSNVIFFIMHSGIKYEQGVFYSLDGKKPTPNITVIKEMQKITGHWFYYEGK